MKQELLRAFRNKVNEENLILQIFRDQNSKNKWSILCSAMDWIEVSISGIDISELSRGNDNQASIKMITFISCIDIMWEAVQQLHRVLFDTTKIPFPDDKSVFKQSVPDNIYFKTIRACFAAHPINLQSVYPDDEKNERWFASWSGGTFSNRDFSVILYSNNPEKQSRFFDISFDELLLFAQKRYEYLEKLMERIEQIIDEYKKDGAQKAIQVRSNIVERIDDLIQENNARFSNDYYNYELQNARLVFSTEIMSYSGNQEVVENYKNALLYEVDEIQDNLQRMILADLMYYVEIKCPSQYQYAFSKLSDLVWGCGHTEFLPWIFDSMKKATQGIVDICEDMSVEEIYVLCCAVFSIK